MNKRFCKVCGVEIHPLRLKALPSAVTCVEHSSAGRKRGRILSLGEGDHNYNELEVLEEDDFIRVRQLESSRGRGDAKASIALEILEEDDFIRVRQLESSRGRGDAKASIALEILDYEKSETSDNHNALQSASRDYVSDPDQDKLS